MEFNLKDELARLGDTRPVLKESDDEFDHDITKAQVGAKSAGEFNDDMTINPMENKRIRASIGDLEDYGTRYKGKKTSRNQIDQADDDSDDMNLHLSADEDDDDDEVMDSADEDEVDGLEDDEDDDEEEEEAEIDDEGNNVKAKKVTVQKEANLNIMNNNLTQEVEKGKAVKSQLGFWEFLLETRVKLQNVLNVVNQFPQHNNYDEVLDSLNSDMKKSTGEILNENKKTLLKLMNQSIELQQLMFSTDKETTSLVDSVVDQTKHLKRNAAGSDGSESEDEDDEEIYSDTDEEYEANQGKRKAKDQKPSKNLNDMNIKHFKPDLIEGYLEKVNKNFAKFKNSTIQKWYDKTRLTSGKSFESFEKPILAQIEHILTDKDRLIKRTQLKRTSFKICGKSEDAPMKLEDLSNRHINDYDAEIFDDQDFYNQLMRELIERQTSNIVDPIELSRKSIELQKLRSKNKKVVDTKASKGRKIKFVVHKPMVNFMAPIYRTTMPEEGRNELFRSLFGNHITMATSTNGSKVGGDLGFNDLFKKM